MKNNFHIYQSVMTGVLYKQTCVCFHDLSVITLKYAFYRYINNVTDIK